MSMQSELVRWFLRASRLKQRYGTREGMRRLVSHKQTKRESPPGINMRRDLDICEYDVNNFPVYHLQLRKDKPSRHVLYIHGGAYVAAIVQPHWSFIHRLMKASPCQVTVPLYGLAPEHDFREGFALIEQVYRNLLERHQAKDIVLMGDSAGGGMALAFAQALLKKDLPQPGAVVMLSPWLDITMSNPEAADVVKRDPMLDIPGAQEAGAMWSAGADPTMPLLSPINGPLTGLPPLCLLIGTHDMLMPDARRFRDKAKADGLTLHYSEYPRMFHTWMLLPLPESNTAVREVGQFLETIAT